MQPDLARDEIDLLIDLLLQIDDTIDAEAGHRISVLRVERDEAIPRVT